MSTKYPNAIDSNTELPLNIDNITPVKAEVVNNLRGAILAIEQELGINPSREFSTVRARLDQLQAAITGTSVIIGGLNFNRVVVTDSSGAISTQIPLLGQQFAVFMETVVGTMGWSRLTEDMILPSFAVTLLGGHAIEVGSTIITPAFTATYNRTPISAILTDNNGSPPKDVTATPNSFTSNGTFTKNIVNASIIFTDTANDGNVTRTSSTTFTWEQKNYFGVSTAGQTSAAFILTLTGVLSPILNTTFTVTANVNQKIYFACRAAYTPTNFLVNGFNGGFNQTANVSFTNASGFTENFKIFESTNSNLGITTVSIS